MEELQKKLREAIKEFGLEEYEEHFVKWLKPRFIITREPMTDDGPVGLSKLGGQPDLPDSVEWPRYNDEPMVFVAQINLSEVTAVSSQHPLPRTGLLSFFYDQKQGVWGSRLEHKGGWKVFYFEEPFQELKRRPFPKDLPNVKYARFRPLRASYEFFGGALPGGYYDPYRTLFLKDAELENAVDQLYDVICPRIYYEEDIPYHRLLGWWDPLQGGNLDIKCEVVTNGHRWSVDYFIPEKETQQYERDRYNWQLLLQVEGDPLNGMEWGDSGHLLFFINKHDLEQKCFDNVWLIFECC